MKAAQCEAGECVAILVKSGGNVSAADVSGSTAPQCAAALAKALQQSCCPTMQTWRQ